MNCPNLNCKYKNSDDLCQELFENCRIYKIHNMKQIEKRVIEEENQRQINLTDIGIAQRSYGRFL